MRGVGGIYFDDDIDFDFGSLYPLDFVQQSIVATVACDTITDTN